MLKVTQVIPHSLLRLLSGVSLLRHDGWADDLPVDVVLDLVD